MRWPWIRRPRILAGDLETGTLDELYMCIAHRDNSEAVLLWTLRRRASDGKEYTTLQPIIASTETGIRALVNVIKAGDGYEQLAGEDISIRHYRTYEFVDWMRKS